jgi:predicted choloylglycine hydrolase
MTINKKLSFFFIIALSFSFALKAETLCTYNAPSGTGWLEKTSQGDLVLHLEGTWYDMGYEQGKLLTKEAIQTMNGVKSYAKDTVPFLPYKTVKNLLYKKAYLKSEPYVPEEFKQELQGLADAAGVSVKELEALHALIYVASCSATAAFGPATKDGNLYQTRSLDFILTFIDPETDTPMQNNSMIVVYKPKGGVPFVSFSWPGMLGSVGGMNAKGISVSEMSLPTKHESPAGLSMVWRIKQTLAKAETLDQAVNLMTQKPLEGGYNFVVGDGKIPSAVAMEMDAKNLYYGGVDGAAENNQYRKWGRLYKYESKPGLLTRTNHPLSKELIKDYQAPIDPENSKNSKGTSGARYRDLRSRDLKEYGSLDLVRVMEVMREHYESICGPDHQGCPGVLYQAAMAPKSGDFLISFAYGDPRKEGHYKVSPYSHPYHKYNLFDLLNEKPEK